jgi:hypothetical protein
VEHYFATINIDCHLNGWQNDLDGSCLDSLPFERLVHELDDNILPLLYLSFAI